jgi:hypothetical protein
VWQVRGGKLRRVGWAEALDDLAGLISSLGEDHGRSSIA